MSALQEAALNYHRARGWMPHPLKLNPMGLPKVPITLAWEQLSAAPDDEATILALDWSSAKGLGLVLGRASGNLAVIDIDDEELAAAVVAWAVRQTNRPLFERTARNRLHVFVIEPEPSPHRNLKVAFNGRVCDVQILGTTSEGGGDNVAIAPTPGYAMDYPDDEPAYGTALETWRQIMQGVGAVWADAPGAGAGNSSMAGGAGYPRPWQSRVPVGQRNDAQFDEACALAEGGMDINTAIAFMRWRFVTAYDHDPSDNPTAGDKAMVTTIASAYRHINRKLRDVQQARVEVPPGITVEERPAEAITGRLKHGGTAIFDAGTEAVALFGEGDEVLAVQGEPTMIYGPGGAGKSTIGQQFVLASIGVKKPELFGLPVSSRKRWLYLALDRPAQIKRSFRRMVTEDDITELDERLIIHDGPLDFDIALEPERLLELAMAVQADAVMIDSLKDAAADIEKTVGGQGVNRAHQLLVSNGVELVVLHHPRKSQVGNKKPMALDDVYGSRFIVDGMGSVILIWGEAGDAVVELMHLKQPRNVVGPWTLIHDHEKGATTRQDAIDAYSIIMASNGISANGLARQLYKTADPTRAQELSATRKARAVVNRGLAHERPAIIGGANDGHRGSSPALFFQHAPHNDEKSPTKVTDVTDTSPTRLKKSPTLDKLSDTKVTDGFTDITDGFTDETGRLFRETAGVVDGWPCPVCDLPLPDGFVCHAECVPEWERMKREGESI